MTASPGSPVGPLGEEAARLASALQDWTARTFPPPARDAGADAGAGADDGAGAGAGHRHGGIATGAPECSLCPLCRLISVLRGEDPELTARLLDAGTAVVSAVRGIADALAERSGSPEPPAPRPAGDGAPRRVERVEFDGPDSTPDDRG